MKRDYLFIRELLLKMESNDNYYITNTYVESDYIPSTPDPLVVEWYHLQLLCDVGYVQQAGTHYRMTSEGHDFLEAIRDDGIWGKTNAAIDRARLIDIPIDLFYAIAVSKLKEIIFKTSGIEL